MKLAILVVYFLQDEMMKILDLHLEALETLTTGDFVIYGVASRVSPRVRQRLAACPRLKLLEFEPTAFVGSEEHSHYLDWLCKHAVQEGASHLSTLDVDAFPIQAEWHQALLKHLADGDQLAAVLREENDDTSLPHPSCCFFPAEFYARYSPEFLPSEELLAGPDFASYLKQPRQRPDAGIGVGYCLWHNGIPWRRLKRSNQVDDHFILAGIYGALVFHLGAMSWQDRDLRGDRNRTFGTRNLDGLAALFQSIGLFRGQIAAVWRHVNHLATRRLVHLTNLTFDRIVAAFSLDATSYIHRLAGVNL